MIKCISIDDDKLFLVNLTMQFEQIKSAELIATFDNPVEGIMACVKLKPDVLLLDYEMPYLDGLDAIEVMEEKPKIIMISAHMSGPKTLDLPVDGFISKLKIESPSQIEAVIKEVMSK
ncbi:MAG: response regulator [Cyclobacteriaceae bacterium]